MQSTHWPRCTTSIFYSWLHNVGLLPFAATAPCSEQEENETKNVIFVRWPHSPSHNAHTHTGSYVLGTDATSSATSSTTIIMIDAFAGNDAWSHLTKLRRKTKIQKYTPVASTGVAGNRGRGISVAHLRDAIMHDTARQHMTSSLNCFLLFFCCLSFSSSLERRHFRWQIIIVFFFCSNPAALLTWHDYPSS